MWVCKEHCDPEIIEKFLQYNPKLNLKNKQGQTALHIMVCHRSSFTCPYILIEREQMLMLKIMLATPL